MANPEDVLKKLPKQTPLWAVGLVTIIVAVTVSISAFYLLSRSEIQQYLASSLEIRKMLAEAEKNTDETKAKDKHDTTLAILNLVSSNATQITQLSEALNKTQESNLKLTNRVSVMEKDLAVSLEKLKDCEARQGAVKK